MSSNKPYLRLEGDDPRIAPRDEGTYKDKPASLRFLLTSALFSSWMIPFIILGLLALGVLVWNGIFNTFTYDAQKDTRREVQKLISIENSTLYANSSCCTSILEDTNQLVTFSNQSVQLLDIIALAALDSNFTSIAGQLGQLVTFANETSINTESIATSSSTTATNTGTLVTSNANIETYSQQIADNTANLTITATNIQALVEIISTLNGTTNTSSLVQLIQELVDDSQQIVNTLDKVLVAQAGVSAFNEKLVAPRIPLWQGTFVYGIANAQLWDLETYNGGTSSFNNSLGIFTATGDSTNFVYSVARSTQYAEYNPGQGNEVYFTAVFGNNCTGCRQYAGMLTTISGYGIGYNSNGRFGVFRRAVGGQQNIYQLTITTAATTPGTCYLTLDSVAYAIPVTAAGGLLSFTAYEISVAGVFEPLWTPYQTGNDVCFNRLFSGPNTGINIFTANGTGIVASLTEVRVGADVNEIWTYQEDWNMDPLDGSGESGVTLDPQTGNVYSIQYQWLGFGNIRFAIRAPLTTQNQIVFHEMVISNVGIYPSVQFPSLPFVLVASVNESTSESTSMSMASAGLFLEGINKIQIPQYAFTSFLAFTGTAQNILVLKNSLIRNNFVNRGSIHVISISPTGQSSLGAGDYAEITLYVSTPTSTLGDGTTADYPNFETVAGNTNSMAVIDTTSRTESGARLVLVLALSQESPVDVDISQHAIILNPGEYLIVRGRNIQGSLTGRVSVFWTESSG